VKVALVLAVALLGGWNRFRLVQRVADEPGRLRSVVIAEVALLAVVIGVTAAIVVTPPGGQASATTAATTVERSTVVVDDEDRSWTVTVAVEPGAIGDNVMIVTLEPDSEVAPVIDEVRLRVSLPDLGVGPTRLAAVPDGSRWRSDGIALPVAGEWLVEVFAATAGTVVRAEVTVPVG
jgi:copper transport protein